LPFFSYIAARDLRLHENLIERSVLLVEPRINRKEPSARGELEPKGLEADSSAIDDLEVDFAKLKGCHNAGRVLLGFSILKYSITPFESQCCMSDGILPCHSF
jgi:hypothetical protein